MRKLFESFFLGLIFTSCGGMPVQDPSISVVAANYPSLEIITQDDFHNGLAIIEVDEGQALSALGIRIQGYYKGLKRIYSKGCGINEIGSYVDSLQFTINADKAFKDSCIISAVISPIYPYEDKAGIATYPLEGHIALVKKRTIPTYNQVLKIKRGIAPKKNLYFDAPFAMLTVAGCGVRKEQTLQIKDRNFELDFEKLSDFKDLTTCVLQVLLSNPQKSVLYRYFIAVYDENFRPLSFPKASLEDEILTVSSEPVVSMLGAGNTLIMGTEAKFDPEIGTIFRALTVKGRLIVCRLEALGLECKP